MRSKKGKVDIRITNGKQMAAILVTIIADALKDGKLAMEANNESPIEAAFRSLYARLTTLITVLTMEVKEK